jgi:flagellar rod assembly protein/muramidase FlgJ
VNPQEFIAALSGPARTSAAVTKIPASFVVADAALESGWGTSQLSLQAFNLFGVKSTPDWTGPTIDMPTGEFVNGQRVTVEATWRKYGSWLEAIQDHASFLLNNPRYKPAFAYTNGSTFAIAIAAAGYATDPQYGQKLVSIIKTHNLSSLDTA